LYVETTGVEQPSEGLGAKVGAVLINDVPDSALSESEQSVGYFEQHCDVGSVSNGPAYTGEEGHGIVNVLQGMPAADKITGVAGVSLRIEVLDEANPSSHSSVYSSIYIARIKADTTVVTESTKLSQKLSFSATNFDYVLASQFIVREQVLRQRLRIFLELRRKVERILVVLIVDQASRIKC
jgi:hypothetical protein